MIKDIISNEYFMLALTFGVFYAAKTLQRRLGWVLFNPILIAIAIIIVPFLTIGRYKNKRYAADSEYRARIDAMNENPEAAQAFQPTAEAAGH